MDGATSRERHSASWASEWAKVARMAGAPDAVLGFDPRGCGALRQGLQVRRVARASCDSDFVSVHCVLNDATRGLIGSRPAMKPWRSYQSRGAIVDEAHCCTRCRSSASRAQRSTSIAGTADEDRASAERALRMDNAIVFPHLTFFTRGDAAAAGRDARTVLRDNRRAPSAGKVARSPSARAAAGRAFR